MAVLGTAAVSLLLAGLVSLLLVRWADRHATQTELEQEATVLAVLMETTPFEERRRSQRLLRAVEELRRNDVSVLRVRNQSISGEFPDNVLPEDLLPLVAGDKKSVSGIRGSTAWAAAIGERPGRHFTAIVLTDDADQFLGTVLLWLGVSSAISLGLGALVAVALSRRISEPIQRARDATRQIAEGDLKTRLPVAKRRGDEISDLSTSINNMAESLERSQNLERQFLMSVSHDLRTPLTSIRGYSEAIADGTAADQEQAARVIIAESARLERLVSDLLDLARLDAREFAIEHQLVDVDAVVRQACAGFAQEAAEREIALEVGMLERSRQESVSAWCDPVRLSQIVANLVQNALKFAYSRVEVNYRRESQDDEETAVISVADDGPGISEMDLPHVFERIYVAKHTPLPQEVGSGLGLAIVAELAEAMGGTASVAARHPEGTRFTVVLPSRAP